MNGERAPPATPFTVYRLPFTAMTEPLEATKERPPYLAAAITALVIFGIYLATLAPTTAFWDTSEYMAAARVLGIPHPPGNPLFTLLAQGR